MISSTVGSSSYGLSLSIDDMDVNEVVRFDSKGGFSSGRLGLNNELCPTKFILYLLSLLLLHF